MQKAALFLMLTVGLLLKRQVLMKKTFRFMLILVGIVLMTRSLRLHFS